MRIEGENYIYEISNEYIVNWHLSLEMLILSQFSHKKKPCKYISNFIVPSDKCITD